MPKKVKLNMEGLKIQSFVTSLEDSQKEEVKGGLPYTCRTCGDCSWTYFWYCPPTDTLEPQCRTACGCTNNQATYCPCL